MVISRSDIKKRRKEEESLDEDIQGSPKRTKVHAQRKFAQGSSNLSSPALTPVKDKDKVKSNGTVVSPELIPSKRPKTEDFLTFLCFRGTPILPARLDFFNTAPVQETIEEDGGSVAGESSKAAPVASTSSSRPSRMADQPPQSQPTPRKNEKVESIAKRRPTAAVQALKKKYQEQRLARQRAGNLSKLVQKVKDKNMVRTRSAALMEETKSNKRIISAAKHVVKKSPVKIIHAVRKLRPIKRSPLRRILLRRREISREILARRRGLRSGGQLPVGSDQGIINERALKPAEPKGDKKVTEKNASKSFASTLSDFSSDDDQPLVKKTKPVEQQRQLQKQQQNQKNRKQQLARRVIKRIVERSRRQKPQIVTRSRLQETETKQRTSSGVSVRPTRKTKEAAAIYMELLGKKLATPDQEVDEDSLSIDSFPELPNSRRIEQQENEIKAKAVKTLKTISKSSSPLRSRQTKVEAPNKTEKKGADDENLKGKDTKKVKTPSAKPKLAVKKEETLGKEKVPEERRKLLARRKVENEKQGSKCRVKIKTDAKVSTDSSKESKEVVHSPGLKAKVKLQATQEKKKCETSLGTKTQITTKEKRTPKEQEGDDGGMKQPQVPRRSLRAPMKDPVSTISESSESTASESAASKNLRNKDSSPSSPSRALRKPRALESALDDKFSDSDEEPLGKIALKNAAVKALNISNKDTQNSSTGKANKVDVKSKIEAVVTEKDKNVPKKSKEHSSKITSSSSREPRKTCDSAQKSSKLKLDKVQETRARNVVDLSKKVKKSNDMKQVTKDARRPKNEENTKNEEGKPQPTVAKENTRKKPVLSGSTGTPVTSGQLKSNKKGQSSEQCAEASEADDDSGGNKKKLLIEEVCAKTVSNETKENTTEKNSRNSVDSETVFSKNKELNDAKCDTASPVVLSSEQKTKEKDNLGKEESKCVLEGNEKKCSNDLKDTSKKIFQKKTAVDKEIVKKHSRPKDVLKASPKKKVCNIDKTHNTSELPCSPTPETESQKKMSKIESSRRSSSSWTESEMEIQRRLSLVSLKESDTESEDADSPKQEGVSGKRRRSSGSQKDTQKFVNSFAIVEKRHSSIRTNSWLFSEKRIESVRSDGDRLRRGMLEEKQNTKEEVFSSRKAASFHIENKFSSFSSGSAAFGRKHILTQGTFSSLRHPDSSLTSSVFGPHLRVPKPIPILSKSFGFSIPVNTQVEVPYLKTATNGTEAGLFSKRNPQNDIQFKMLSSSSTDDYEMERKCVPGIMMSAIPTSMNSKKAAAERMLNMERPFERKLSVSSDSSFQNDEDTAVHKTVPEIQEKAHGDLFVGASAVLDRNCSIPTGRHSNGASEKDVSGAFTIEKDGEGRESLLFQNESSADKKNAVLSKSVENLAETQSMLSISSSRESVKDIQKLLGFLSSPESEIPPQQRYPTVPYSCQGLSELDVPNRVNNSLLQVTESQESQRKEKSKMVSPKGSEMDSRKLKPQFKTFEDIAKGNCAERSVDCNAVINKDVETGKEMETRLNEERPVAAPPAELPDFDIPHDMRNTKSKTKVNMSTERIEKWLNESYSDNIEHKRDCSVFTTNVCKCSSSADEDDYFNDKLVIDSEYSCSEVEDNTPKMCDSVFSKVEQDSYKTEVGNRSTAGTVRATSSGKSGYKLNVQNKVSPLREKVAVGSPGERTPSNLNFVFNTSASQIINVEVVESPPTKKVPAEDPVSKKGSTETRKEYETHKSKPIMQDKVTPVTASGSAANHNILNHTKNVGTYPSNANRAEKPSSFAKTKKVKIAGKVPTPMKSPGHKIQPSPEKKSIFQQRRSFSHKVKARKELVPSANAFSPENESSVYAFESDSELPPLSTPFRRNTRDSRTSSTTTSKSEEDLTKLGETDVPSPPTATVQPLPMPPPVISVPQVDPGKSAENTEVPQDKAAGIGCAKTVSGTVSSTVSRTVEESNQPVPATKEHTPHLNKEVSGILLRSGTDPNSPVTLLVLPAQKPTEYVALIPSVANPSECHVSALQGNNVSVVNVSSSVAGGQFSTAPVRAPTKILLSPARTVTQKDPHTTCLYLAPSDKTSVLACPVYSEEHGTVQASNVNTVRDNSFPATSTSVPPIKHPSKILLSPTHVPLLLLTKDAGAQNVIGEQSAPLVDMSEVEKLKTVVSEQKTENSVSSRVVSDCIAPTDCSRELHKNVSNVPNISVNNPNVPEMPKVLPQTRNIPEKPVLIVENINVTEAPAINTEAFDITTTMPSVAEKLSGTDLPLSATEKELSLDGGGLGVAREALKSALGKVCPSPDDANETGFEIQNVSLEGSVSENIISADKEDMQRSVENCVIADKNESCSMSQVTEKNFEHCDTPVQQPETEPQNLNNSSHYSTEERADTNSLVQNTLIAESPPSVAPVCTGASEKSSVTEKENVPTKVRNFPLEEICAPYSPKPNNTEILDRPVSKSVLESSCQRDFLAPCKTDAASGMDETSKECQSLPNVFEGNTTGQLVRDPHPEKLYVHASSQLSVTDERTISLALPDKSQQQLEKSACVQVDILNESFVPGQKTSTSIAVQVNLDSDPDTGPPEPEPPQRSMEISTQTEGGDDDEDDEEGHLFYIPLQSSPGSCHGSSSQMIQGVAVKLGTEGPTGPNQRVIMRAKLVTKPPNFSRSSASAQDSALARRSVLGAPSQRSITQSRSTPVGTVQPTARGRPISTDATTTTVEHEVTPRSPAPVVKQPVSVQSLPKERRGSADQSAAGTSSKSALVPSKRGPAKAKCVKSSDSNYVITPINSSAFPAPGGAAQLVEAPTFRPTEKEFQDPLEFIDKIRPIAEKFGLCRVVPPQNFKPECKVSDEMRFTAYNQYVHKMLHRWGPNVREMMAIKKYLATQSILLNNPPWVGGMEVDLPRLYQTVQSFGGLKEVIEKKKWQRVADGMKIPKAAQDRVTKLDDIYCKYLLPYDTLSPGEREKLFEEVEKEWALRESRLPVPDNTSSTGTHEDDSSDGDTSDENEECIVKGRSMALSAFYRIARNTMAMWFKQPEPLASEVEQEFWKHVVSRQAHVCVHSGSIDSSGWGYGFPVSKNSPFAKHPWNLKVLTNNSGSVLRSLGPVMGVTVPTLHVGMLFATCCWYRDPHGLPWIEYLHTGASKIWYGIPDTYSTAFRNALGKLVPRYCRNRTIWLPSDTAMVPPPMLVQHGVSLCHTVQEPGQFIIVFPRAFTSSICTGYLVSESVYFAQPHWLDTAEQVFKDIQESCEPSMFSLERLLFSIATDTRSNLEVLKQVLPMILKVRERELDQRKQLFNLGLKTSERLPLPEKKKYRPAREEDGDYECEICRANLFVSLVTNSHEEGVYCLPHAIDLLTKKRHHLKYCKLMYTYDQSELHELVQKLQDRIDAKSHRKSQPKHSAPSQK
ncbi:uncharacterized protein LOC124794633 [Schistocerca piceifrons]|uniref:uncharacterized protein LOC124794633 n=1 Tax=Schistocerca piceifrons TaxID=274613 RepID=UPI001F5F4A57|nr:uncharacterized protein LOC124794633 [Schistocerca piceifrons]